MPIEFNCTNCQRKLRVPDENAGQNARCPQCQSVQKIPNQQDSGSPPPAGGGQLDWDDFGGAGSQGAAPVSTGNSGYGAGQSGYGNAPANSGYGNAPANYGSAPNPYATPPSSSYGGGGGYRSSPDTSPSPVAIISLICGIMSLPFSLCCILGIPLSIGAVVCGCIGIAQSKGKSPAGLGISIAGLCCGLLSGFVVLVIVVLNIIVEVAK